MKGYLELMRQQIREITHSFAGKLRSLAMNITHIEMTVAHHLAAGRTTKNIAQLMGISVSTVDFHRRNLRQKLGIKNRGKSLQSYLALLRE